MRNQNPFLRRKPSETLSHFHNPSGFVGLFLLFLLLVVFSIVPLELNALSDDFVFTNISLEQGLSQVTVLSILQDKQGMMWFGTAYGLNRFDGYDFTVYTHKREDPRSLSDNYITALLESRSGCIWVGTFQGHLNCFDPLVGNFRSYRHRTDDSATFSGHEITALLESETDDHGLWVGTKGGGLQHFNMKTGIVSHFLHDPGHKSSLCHNDIYALAMEPDTGGRFIWCAGEAGICRFDVVEKTFQPLILEPKQGRFRLSDVSGDGKGENEASVPIRVHALLAVSPTEIWVGAWGGGLMQLNMKTGELTAFTAQDGPAFLIHNFIQCLRLDYSGKLWVGTPKGIGVFNRNTRRFGRCVFDPLSSWSISDNQICSIYEDRSRVIWVGTWNGGIDKMDIKPRNFKTLVHHRGNSNSISNDNVRCVRLDSQDNLWCGTAVGLNKLERHSGQFTHYVHRPDDNTSLSDNFIVDLFEDISVTLWVGTQQGLNRFDPQTQTFKRFRHDEHDPESIGGDFIIHMVDDPDDRQNYLMVGTLDAGISRMHKKTGKCIRYVNDPRDSNSLSNNKVLFMYPQEDEYVWVGTGGGGLNRFHLKSGIFTHYRNNAANPHSLSNDRVVYIAPDPDAGDTVLWIATWGGGLNSFHVEEEKFFAYTQKHGLPTDLISGILADSKGMLWISTAKGIARLNPRTGMIKVFDVAVGNSFNAFNAAACFRSHDGEIFLGGLKGLTTFHPLRITGNPYPADAVITSFRIFNRRVIPETPLSHTTQLNLSHADKFFSFRFAALEYTQPIKNRFRYKLEGFDHDWIETDARQRLATYTNLNPGHYVFHVKASNNDGIWNGKEVSLNVVIVPPFWGLFWVKVLLVVLLVGTVFMFYRYRVRIINEREQKMAEANREINRLAAERKNLETALKKSGRYMKTLLETVNEGFLEINAHFDILEVNPEFCAILDRSRNDIVGKSLLEFVEPREAPNLRRQLRKRIKGEKGVYQLMMVRPDKSTVLCLMKGTPLMDAQDNFRGSIALVKDITQDVAMQKVMVQSEKILSLGGLAAGMGHQINNPLAGIMQNLQVIRKRLWSDLPKNQATAQECGFSFDMLKRYVEERDILSLLDLAGQSGRRVSEIIDGMLAFSRRHEIEFESHSLSQLLDQAVEMAANDDELKHQFDFREIDIVRRYESDIPGVHCDAAEIKQVFLNILKNGVHAMCSIAHPGTVSRFTLRVKDDPVNRMVQVEIADNGPGMNAATAKRVFDPFFTTKKRGGDTGLGLSVSYFIITQNHCGLLTVETELGAGATFVIRLPYKPNEFLGPMLSAENH